jgi:hypothetical protein
MNSLRFASEQEQRRQVVPTPKDEYCEGKPLVLGQFSPSAKQFSKPGEFQRYTQAWLFETIVARQLLKKPSHMRYGMLA